MPSAPDLDTETAAVRALWEDLGIPGLMDIHTHFMPQSVMDKVWAFFDEHGHGARERGLEWPITYRFPQEQRLATLRAFGVRRFTSLVYAHKPGMAQWLNEWSAGFAAATPDCAHTATFHAEPEAAAYVPQALDAGAEVFKVHVQVGGFDPADPLLDPVWGVLADAGTPIVLHAGSGPEPGPHTGPGPVRQVLARHPRLTLVIAHLGMPEYADFLALAAAHPRVHLDTTMAFTEFTSARMPFPRELRARLVELGDRIVLGSDFPNIPHPYLHQLQVIERLGLGRRWTAAVLWHNGARLLGVGDRAGVDERGVSGSPGGPRPRSGARPGPAGHPPTPGGG